MRARRLLAALLLTAAAAAVAILLVFLMVPRSTTEAPSVQAEAPAPTPPATGIRLVIPTLGVDAPIVTAGRDAKGDMAAPTGPHEVNWYDFTAKPGEPGNAVMAGHLNWRDGTIAVFAKLATVAPGDPVQVVEDNGQTLRYRVVSVEDVDAFTTDVATVLNWTAPESLTLITCSGQFVWTAASYSERTIVRAERIADPST
jgi:LPXTG-site transpeptidase (sortase) family protein